MTTVPAPPGKEIEPIYADPRPGDVRHSLADVSKAREALGYEPAVNAREGLRRVFSWYEDRRASGSTAASV